MATQGRSMWLHDNLDTSSRLTRTAIHTAGPQHVADCGNLLLQPTKIFQKSRFELLTGTYRAVTASLREASDLHRWPTVELS